MLKMFKNKKAQNTAEYAILIALVVGGVIAMQTYAQRALQGRLRDASVGMRDNTSVIGNTLQYEPYYQDTASRKDKTAEKLENAQQQSDQTITSTLQAGFKDNTVYSNAAVDTTSTGITGAGM